MDKHFQRSCERFLRGGYYDQLMIDPDAVYYQPDSSRELEGIDILLEEAANLSTEPIDTANFIYNFYQKYKFNGMVFGSSQRFCRALPAAIAHLKDVDSLISKTVDILKKEPRSFQKLAAKIRTFSDDTDKFTKLAGAQMASRSYGGKDQLFLSNKLLQLKYESVTARTKMEKFEKSFLQDNMVKILSQLKVTRSVKKAPDGVIRNKNYLVVIENKFQMEGGGGQNLSRGDGEKIFSYSNSNEKFQLKTVFCFDGNYGILGDDLRDLITDDNKIMSILDVIEYVESL